jgi:hypothetical protein
MLNILALALAMVPMFFKPLWVLESQNESINISGMTYKIVSNNNKSFYCFNLRFLNFKRHECVLANIDSD